MSRSDQFAEADEILHKEIDKHMEHLREDYPQFYEEYFDARRIRHAGIRHRPDAKKDGTTPPPSSPEK